MALMSRNNLLIAGAAFALTLGVISLMSRGGSAVADEGDPAKGLAIAQANCSKCHAVESGGAGKSPVPEAPAFETLGQLWPVEQLEEALAEGIMVGHEQYQMPVFQFAPEEIDDLIAYLKSIQVPAAPAQ